MAPAYSGYNQYWDPANSQARSQQGYTYQGQADATPSYLEPSTTAPSVQNSTYQASYPTDSSYTRGWYGANGSTSNAPENRAAETLSSLSTQVQDRTVYGASGRAATTTTYPSFSNQSNDSTYTNNRSYQQSPQQTQSEFGSAYTQNAHNSSSQYPSQSHRNSSSAVSNYPSATATANRHQSSTSSQFRSNSPYQQQRPPSVHPPASQKESLNQRKSTSLRDNQPTQPVGYTRTLTPSAVQQQARNQPQWRASNEPPAPSTVDPTQVYDPWPEQQRQAQIAAEQRRQAEEEKRKAEDIENARVRQEAEEREAEKSREAERLREEVEAKRKAEEDQKAAEAAEKTRKAAVQKAKQQAKADKKSMDAARTLARAAAAQGPAPSAEQGDGMEEEMRKLFEKMREFNARDPKMLARMWEEERQAHVAKASPAAPSPVVETSQPALRALHPDPVQPTATNQTLPPPARPQANISTPLMHATGPGRKSGQQQKSNERPGPQAPAAIISGTPAPAPSPMPVPSRPSARDQITQQAPQSTAIWPAGKNRQLAQAAVKWLQTKPGNASKNISVDTVVALLNSNPSYIMLCESLERLGLSLDRGAFAIALLKAVPDLRRTTPAATVANQQNLVNGTSTAAEQTAPSVNTSSIQPNKSTSLAEMYRSAVNEPAQALSKQPIMTQAQQHTPAAKMPNMHAQYLAQPARNKLEAARKRGFAELVDLTAGGESDEEVPSKVPNLAQNTGFGFGQTTDQHLGQMMSAFSNKISNQESDFPTQEKELKGKIIVQTILREKVARKSRYDSRSIARDVLLATGRHPEMRALNSHLMGMQEMLLDHSADIELNKFDLATIRWDLIDPGDPILEEEDHKNDLDDMDADDEDEAPAQVRSTQRVDHGDGTVSLVETREPTGGLKGRFSLGRRPGRPRKSAPVGVQSRPAGFGDTPHRQVPASNPQSESTRRPAQASQTSQPSQSAALGSSSGVTQPSGSAIGYGAFRTQQKFDENGNPIKRMGRPVGWRKSIHGKAAQQGSQGAPSSSHARANRSDVPSYDQVKRRGRPPKQQQTEAAPKDVEPHFNVYECKWDDCNAELHNIDTLRKHIIKIHGKQSGRFKCLWADCVAEQDAKGKQPVQRAQFDGILPWTNHMERSHINPVARRLGDGPRGGLSGEQS